MNAQLNVHMTKYHSSKAAEYARIYQGCDFVVSADYASQLESERDALQARVKQLEELLGVSESAKTECIFGKESKP